jgi:sterol desaturase/sphingolipid hydroxylase (fatty acid hydroxylase superfamily)
MVCGIFSKRGFGTTLGLLPYLSSRYRSSFSCATFSSPGYTRLHCALSERKRQTYSKSGKVRSGPKYDTPFSHPVYSPPWQQPLSSHGIWVGRTSIAAWMNIPFGTTYYYWLHRWMHQPRVFKHIHKVHHRSIQPTVFTSFSFHPLEALLQFAYFPVILIVVPVHYSMLLAVLTLFTISALINHSGQEIYGNANVRRHIIGAGHHEVHHKSFHHNYGLFFTWWDQWMGTTRDP